MIQALPQSLRDEAERLATSIHYGHEAWGEIRGETADDLMLMRDAIVQCRTIRACYTSRAGQQASLTLRPLGLVAKAGEWYLVADESHGPRTYRVTRMTDVSITNDGFNRPRDFDLVDYWRTNTDEVEALRSGVAATLLVQDWIAPILQQQFGRYCTVLGHESEQARVEIRAHRVVSLAEQLAGWGNRINVVSPAELREELHRIGTELVAHTSLASNDHGAAHRRTPAGGPDLESPA